MLLALLVTIVGLVVIFMVGARVRKRRRVRAAARARYYAAQCPACLKNIPVGAIVCMHCLAPIKSTPVEVDNTGERVMPVDAAQRSVVRPLGVLNPRTLEGGVNEGVVRTGSRDLAGNGKTGA